MSKTIEARLTSNKGFTLVELLIVVAIIGVLASQGVPAYKRMIQKSKKGEAQVMLGNIWTAESAFFSEYGMYGNNLFRMGAAMEGSNFIYVAGFVSSSCGGSPNSIVPTTTNAPSLPVQYSSDTGTYFKIGRVGQTICAPVTNAMGEAPTTFSATATGYIRGGSMDTMNACGTGVSNCDVWTMNNDRTIANATDGIN